MELLLMDEGASMVEGELVAEEAELLGESQGGTGDVACSEEELDEEVALAVVEALIFAYGEPISREQLQSASGLTEERLTDTLNRLTEICNQSERGTELVSVAGGRYQFRTKNWCKLYLQRLKAARPRRLSHAALETLAAIAYRQPIVKSDIEKIRGVDATPTIKTLLERGLIRIVGHQQSVGQPALYGTTEEFLKVFGLNELSELPTLRDLAELEKDPGEVESNIETAEVSS